MSVATTYATQTTANAAAQQSAAAARTTLANNFNDFLRLLTTQLQNQDPTSPLDTNQFTSQLVQFASVEQQIRMNTQLEQLIAIGRTEQLGQASSLVGLRAAVASDRLSLQGGVAELRLTPAGPGPVTITITDSAGRTIRTATVQVPAGGAGWSWDGADNGGMRRADGAYGVTVTSAGGAAVPFTVLGTVTGAAVADDAVQLSLGALSVGFDRLRGVAAP